MSKTMIHAHRCSLFNHYTLIEGKKILKGEREREKKKSLLLASRGKKGKGLKREK